MLSLPKIFLAALAATPVQSASPPTEPAIEEVQVEGKFVTPRDAKTLGQLLAAEKIFNDERALAPQGDLKFKVFGRKDAEQWHAVDLGLLAREGRLPVTLDDQGRFAIDDAWRSLDRGTELRSRLQDGKVTWRADIRSPGSTPHRRRLGDLRLQCRASFFSGIARGGVIGSNVIADVLKRVLNGCDSDNFGWSSFADASLFGIRLVHGDRAMQVSLNQMGGLGDPPFLTVGYDWTHALRERMYRLYLGDTDWPDDTLVEFEFAGDPQQPVDPVLLGASNRLADAARNLQPGTTSWAELKQRLGGGQGTIRHENGQRIVLYTLNGKPDLELVVLFDREDRLVKFALRPMGSQPLSEPVTAPWTLG